MKKKDVLLFALKRERQEYQEKYNKRDVKGKETLHMTKL